MAKRPSLFAPPKPLADSAQLDELPVSSGDEQKPLPSNTKRPLSRQGKRVLSLYLDPLAWKQLRQLALQDETTTQALGEEAINLLFTSRGLNRSA
jgi:hypothetical protein